MENNRFHPSFPKPNNINVRIWRYLSFDRFTWLVEKCRLYMPQPRQLEENDNFEGTMPKAQSAWWDEAIRHADSHERAVTIQENKKKLLQVIHSFRTSWFISCWHMGEHENFAFWEIYGKKSNSIAIISTFAKLEALLPSHVLLAVSDTLITKQRN